MKLQTLIEFMETICPTTLAEDWDNVGLLLGSRDQKAEKIMTCLTVTGDVVDEAIALGIDCVISHHPFPFRPEKKWTTDTTAGTLLLKLAAAKIAVYSPHTAHDSAFFGINRQLAAGLELRDVASLYEGKLQATKEMLAGLDDADAKYIANDLKGAGAILGTGRVGRLPKPKKFSELVAQVKDMLQLEHVLAVGADDKVIKTVAIGCGAADDFIAEAAKKGADAILTGEARFHVCEEARAQGIAVILASHFATERFSAFILAQRIARQFPELVVQTSAKETDPIRFA